MADALSAGTRPATNPVVSTTAATYANTRQSNAKSRWTGRSLGSLTAEQQPADPGAQQETGRAAEGREQKRLGDQLPHEPQPPGAERVAQRELLHATRAARQQQAGDVDARHQQDEDHESDEDRADDGQHGP